MADTCRVQNPDISRASRGGVKYGGAFRVVVRPTARLRGMLPPCRCERTVPGADKTSEVVARRALGLYVRQATAPSLTTTPKGHNIGINVGSCSL